MQAKWQVKAAAFSAGLAVVGVMLWWFIWGGRQPPAGLETVPSRPEVVAPAAAALPLWQQQVVATFDSQQQPVGAGLRLAPGVLLTMTAAQYALVPDAGRYYLRELTELASEAWTETGQSADNQWLLYRYAPVDRGYPAWTLVWPAAEPSPELVQCRGALVSSRDFAREVRVVAGPDAPPHIVLGTAPAAANLPAGWQTAPPSPGFVMQPTTQQFYGVVGSLSFAAAAQSQSGPLKMPSKAVLQALLRCPGVKVVAPAVAPTAEDTVLALPHAAASLTRYNSVLVMVSPSEQAVQWLDLAEPGQIQAMQFEHQVADAMVYKQYVVVIAPAQGKTWVYEHPTQQLRWELATPFAAAARLGYAPSTNLLSAEALLPSLHSARYPVVAAESAQAAGARTATMVLELARLDQGLPPVWQWRRPQRQVVQLSNGKQWLPLARAPQLTPQDEQAYADPYSGHAGMAQTPRRIFAGVDSPAKPVGPYYALDHATSAVYFLLPGHRGIARRPFEMPDEPSLLNDEATRRRLHLVRHWAWQEPYVMRLPFQPQAVTWQSRPDGLELDGQVLRKQGPHRLAEPLRVQITDAAGQRWQLDSWLQPALPVTPEFPAIENGDMQQPVVQAADGKVLFYVDNEHGLRRWNGALQQWDNMHASMGVPRDLVTAVQSAAVLAGGNLHVIDRKTEQVVARLLCVAGRRLSCDQAGIVVWSEQGRMVCRLEQSRDGRFTLGPWREVQAAFDAQGRPHAVTALRRVIGAENQLGPTVVMRHRVRPELLVLSPPDLHGAGRLLHNLPQRLDSLPMLGLMDQLLVPVPPEQRVPGAAASGASGLAGPSSTTYAVLDAETGEPLRQFMAGPLLAAGAGAYWGIGGGATPEQAGRPLVVTRIDPTTHASREVSRFYVDNQPVVAVFQAGPRLIIQLGDAVVDLNIEPSERAAQAGAATTF